VAAKKKVQGDGRPARRAVTRWLNRVLVICAYAYPALLATTCAAFVWVGEDWWVTAALLYAPRVAFGLPLLVLVPWLLLTQRRRLLWTQLIALTLTLFPLMGLVLPWPPAQNQSASFKLLTFNISNVPSDEQRILSAIDAMGADLVLLQEVPGWATPIVAGLRSRFAHVEASSQFVIASRFPILESNSPGRISHSDRRRSPRFMRHLVQSPLGTLAVYNVHPISPRGALGVHSSRDLFHRLRTGKILGGDPETDMSHNATLRAQQIATAAGMASREVHPVLIAGDTNLPGLSAALHRYLSRYRDGFRSASWGFGYTFPQRFPFLRLDRILAGPELDFSEFDIGCRGASDHLCVAARVIRR
jgi:endonuclease/exonuclease/phosphatase family metal-dependent hydrolase